MNIRSRKGELEATRQTIRFFETLLRASTDGIVITDISQNIIVANETFCAFFDAPRRSVVETNLFVWLEQFNGDAQQRWADLEKQVRLEKACHDVEFNLMTMHEDKWLNVNASLLERVADEEVGVIISIWRDVTRRKQAEKALLESKDKYQRLTDNAKDMIYRMSLPDGRYEYVSPASIDLLGYKPEDCYESPMLIQKIIHPAWADYFKEQWENLMSGNMPAFYEYQIIHKSGEERWMYQRNVLILNDDGQPKAIEGIVTDITARKKLTARLQQAQKMESIGTLAGGIAHDFNNILFPIVGCTEMLLEDVPEDSPLRDNLNEVFNGAMRAKELVKQILAFSRQDSHQVKLMRMQPVIKDALKLIRSTIPTSIEIKQTINKECGIIKADPTQVHQVVMNLATNAYHAMEDTGGELKVNLKEVELGEQDLPSSDMEPGPYACLIVADSGTGIDDNVVGKIFDPYFTTKEQGKGTGMGLSVIHGIVKKAGGSIHLYSKSDKGAEFHVYLPVVKSTFDQQEIQSEKPIQGGTEHILLVDDETAIVSMGKQMLERLGYSVVSRTSSVEALEIFRVNPDKFDMVITDMTMPNMSGDKLASELIKIRSDIPILICTGFSERMPVEKAKSMGIKGFLLKPIVMKNLSEKIREVLDKGQENGSGHL